MPHITEILTEHKENPKEIFKILAVDTNTERKSKDYYEEYRGERKRREKSVGFRLPREVTRNGSKVTIAATKIVLPFPKKIVRTAAHFLFGGSMKTVLKDEREENREILNEVWNTDLKMQGKLKRLARTCMIETKSAILFYLQKLPEKDYLGRQLKMRAKIMSHKEGEFYPHFDEYGDMDAFYYKYPLPDKSEIHEIYTDDQRIRYTIKSGNISEPEVIDHGFKKIPVVYVEQSEPEWDQVASSIDQFENRISRLWDTNDYYSEPILKLWGEILQLPEKDRTGKLVQFKAKTLADGKVEKGDAEYLTWDQSPEAIKLELESAWNNIHNGTDTPDLSFNTVKGIGTVSGIAIKLMFMGALIAREDRLEIFGDALNRCISVIVSGINNSISIRSDIDRNLVKVEFNNTFPDDITELINTLSIATGGKPILSQETASEINPLVPEGTDEFSRIKEQEETNSVNESFQL